MSVYVALSSGLTGRWWRLAVPHRHTITGVLFIVHASLSALQPEASLHVECSVECLRAKKKPSANSPSLYPVSAC